MTHKTNMLLKANLLLALHSFSLHSSSPSTATAWWVPCAVMIGIIVTGSVPLRSHVRHAQEKLQTAKHKGFEEFCKIQNEVEQLNRLNRRHNNKTLIPVPPRNYEYSMWQEGSDEFKTIIRNIFNKKNVNNFNQLVDIHYPAIKDAESALQQAQKQTTKMILLTATLCIPPLFCMIASKQ